MKELAARHLHRDAGENQQGGIEVEDRRNIEAVRSGMRVFEVSAKSGTGMEDWLGYLESRRAEGRSAGDGASCSHRALIQSKKHEGDP